MKKNALLFCLLALVIVLTGITSVYADDVVTLRFQDWRLAEEPAASALKAIIDAFEEAHPNIKVELEPVTNSERVEKFNNQVRAGEAPDVVRFNVTEVPTEISMGAFEELDQFMEAEGGIEAFYEDFAQFLVETGNYLLAHFGQRLNAPSSNRKSYSPICLIPASSNHGFAFVLLTMTC